MSPGELTAVVGTTGSGKTTLIKIMAGLLQADEGTGRVLGYDIYEQHKQIRASVSLVAPTADVGTDNNLTVRQNLEFWAVVYDLEASRREQRIDELLDRIPKTHPRLFIRPGYRFRVIDLLLTNFHLPESTLLMLVSAFAGHARVMAAYRHAVAQRYRFFSYGDAMLLERYVGPA